MKKVELLAPAGNFDALKGAIKAGADAVYLGGEFYGARAYADNFTQDEICTGIHLAHTFGRKIYLTVNTLVKEKELDGLYNYLLPLYEKGLDGVIVQDLGALRYIREHFPGLALHASTQMTITGYRGASFAKEEGVSRIVPARELSLAEMKYIKSEAGVEIEAFIHGAMCYCYSGQCLLSSILGGRSGNRGRCAQPCRLPYEVQGEKSSYPLSMRDMCTVSILPELIEAGIDSFKIEGRMKKPAYAAGVTAIYRKYIDLYYKDSLHYRVSEEDMSMLRKLYIRSEIGKGYYHSHNGREMITLDSPAYSGADDQLLSQIEKEYISEPLYFPVTANIFLKPESPARLTLTNGSVQVSCKGDTVQKAQNQPLSNEKIEEQVKKSGNSLIKIERVTIETKDDIFMPVRAINELRRTATLSMENELIRHNMLDYKNRKSVIPYQAQYQMEKKEKIILNDPDTCAVHVSVRTKEQLKEALKEQVARIYLEYSLLDEEVIKELQNEKEHDSDCLSELYISTPYIVREKNILYLEKIAKLLENEIFEGVLIRNLESFQFFRKVHSTRRLVLDANLYLWNREALHVWEDRADEFYLPVENNFHEWMELLSKLPEGKLKVSALVYGRLPMMIAANCLNKTQSHCTGKSGMVMLKDRYEKEFPVYTDCASCYNVIYNSVPLSLHRLFKRRQFPMENFRIDLTTEGARESRQLIQYFHDILNKYQEPFYKEYTTGHIKRGVE